MAKINFASGHVFESEGAVSVYEAARSLEIISREVLAAKVNGEVTELSTVVEGEADVQLLTFGDPDGAGREKSAKRNNYGCYFEFHT